MMDIPLLNMSLLNKDEKLCADYNQYVVQLIKDFNQKVNTVLRSKPNLDGNEINEKEILADSQNAQKATSLIQSMNVQVQSSA